MQKINYKNTLLIAALSSFAISNSTAQHNNEFYNDGALVHIQNNAEVHVWGDVHMMGATGQLENNGLLKTQGDMYSDANFQQSGTGTTRIENSDVNIGQTQRISGSYAVRGTGSANKGVDDGSFYNLELANDQGIVWLEVSATAGSTRYVADVRNSVNFGAGGTVNRIITADPSAIPTNGSGYGAVFGVMNETAGLGAMNNNTVSLFGNSSGTDIGYVQGNLRRQIAAGGGAYGYVLGLEPAGAGAQRGMQYARIDFGANTYDVVEGYFESGLSNAIAGSPVECSGYDIDYFGGNDHGQWIFDNPTGGAGSYEMWIWPQDDNYPTKAVWFVTKDNAIDGTPDMCGTSPVGLSRSGFNGFSSFDAAAGDIILETELTDLTATPVENRFIRVDWTTEKESDVDYFIIERSTDNNNFEAITTHTAVGNSLVPQSYFIDDQAVVPGVNYYYRIKIMNVDGTYEYTYVVVASLEEDGNIENVSVFPNPIGGENNVTLEIRALTDQDIHIVVYDAIGQRVYDQSTGMQEGFNQYTLPAKDWADGAYFIHIVGDTFSTTEELIKAD